MIRLFTKLMSRAGERNSAKPSEVEATLPIIASGRGGELFTDGHAASGQENGGTGGYYVGGGTELMLTRDVWDMMNKIGIAGEIGIEYKRFNSQTASQASATRA